MNRIGFVTGLLGIFCASISCGKIEKDDYLNAERGLSKSLSQNWRDCVWRATGTGSGIAVAINQTSCRIQTGDSVLSVVCPAGVLPSTVIGGAVGGTLGVLTCSGRSAVNAVLQISSGQSDSVAGGEQEGSAPEGRCRKIPHDQIGDFAQRHRNYAQSIGMRPLDPRYYFPRTPVPGSELWVYEIQGVIEAAANVFGRQNGSRTVHAFASSRTGAGKRLLQCLEQNLGSPFKVSPSPDSAQWWTRRAAERGVSRTQAADGNYFIFQPR